MSTNWAIKVRHERLDMSKSIKDWIEEMNMLKLIVDEYSHGCTSPTLAMYKQHIDLLRKKIQIARS